MQYRFFICDVFTDRPFGGNQLAVLPEAEGLDDAAMQKIAREFNFSESAFVFPAQEGGTRQVRIFTPTMEVPFAGHPNIGTAFALAQANTFGLLSGGVEVVFEEKAGLVPIKITQDAMGAIRCELQAPQAPTFGPELTVEAMSEVLGLEAGDIETTRHAPQVASVGLPFVITEVKNRGALTQAKINPQALAAITAQGIAPDFHLYCHSADEFDIRARVFAPGDGLPEDPATGSANAALAALILSCEPDSVKSKAWRIAQGVEMGRPSEIFARAARDDFDASTIRAWVAGSAVLVGEGTIYV